MVGTREDYRRKGFDKIAKKYGGYGIVADVKKTVLKIIGKVIRVI